MTRNVARVVLLIAYDQYDRRFDDDAAAKLVEDANKAINARFDSSMEEVVLESVDPHYADVPMVDRSRWTDYGYEHDAEVSPNWPEELTVRRPQIAQTEGSK